MIKFTHKPINLQKVMDNATSLAGGALTVYIGKVRKEANGKEVRWLEYETDESQAVTQIRSIIETATEKYQLKGHAISHRLGTLKPGEETIAVAVSTPHHEASLKACNFILDELNASGIIGQKEVFSDGSEWVSARPEAMPS